ncbi:MAG: hypothetical protein IPM97_00585 [Bdellovibrionaceae bacterium]|nr:hypothetical protein [Pseudobdellovibrionaceae bacterium]
MARPIRRGFLLILLLFKFAGAAPNPFRSKEEIEFITKKEVKLLDFGKSESFVGLLRRPFERNSNLKSADLYALKSNEKSKVDPDLCRQMLGQIFGPIDKISLHVEKIDLFKTTRGPACEAQVVDGKDPKTKIPERRVVIGFINLKAFALVFHFSKKSNSSEQEDIRLFWQSLK